MKDKSQNKKNISTKDVSKNALIYGVGTMLRHVTALVMLPIYTRYLAPSDYGAIELLTMALELIGIVMGLRITQAMFRYYGLEDDSSQKKRIVSTVYIAVFAVTVLAVVVIQAVAPYMVQVLFGNTDYLLEFRVYTLTLITMGITAACMVFIQAQQKPVLYVSFSLLILALQVCGNIYFVVIREMHVLGVVYSAVLSGSVVSIILSIYLIRNVGFGFDVEVSKRLYRFVYPLIFASLLGFYVYNSDKYFLRVFDGLSAVGLYVLAGRISSVIGTVFGALNTSWNAARFEVYKQENRLEIFDQVFKIMSVGLAVVGVGIMLFSRDLIYYMTDSQYHDAAGLVPLFVIAYIIASAVPFVNFGIILKEKTGLMARASVYKAVICSVLYLVLIPPYGAYGAIAGLLIGNMFEAIYVYLKGKGYFDMNLSILVPVYLFVLSVPFVALTWVLPVGGMLNIFLRALSYVLFIRLIFWLPVLTKSDVKNLCQRVCEIPIIGRSMAYLLIGKVSVS